LFRGRPDVPAVAYRMVRRSAGARLPPTQIVNALHHRVPVAQDHSSKLTILAVELRRLGGPQFWHAAIHWSVTCRRSAKRGGAFASNSSRLQPTTLPSVRRPGRRSRWWTAPREVPLTRRAVRAHTICTEGRSEASSAAPQRQGPVVEAAAQPRGRGPRADRPATDTDTSTPIAWHHEMWSLSVSIEAQQLPFRTIRTPGYPVSSADPWWSHCKPICMYVLLPRGKKSAMSIACNYALG